MTHLQGWKNLFKIGAVAALLAGILFRRNIGAEVSLFTGSGAIPVSVLDWYTLIDAKPFIGLSFLAVFDLVNYLLVGVVFVSLGVALWQKSKSQVVIALTLGLMGVATALSTNISLTMVSLTHQYFEALTEASRNALLLAGQSLLSSNNPMGGFPNTGSYVSYLLIALAGIILASLLLSTHRKTAIVGLLAAGSDLVFCLTIPFWPGLQAYLMSFAGAFWMLWHILLVFLFYRLAKLEKE